MAMLANARNHLPHLHALLMTQSVYDNHRHQTVAEPTPADAGLYARLPPHELAVAQYLRAQDCGRLEQEFLPGALVEHAVLQWLHAT